MEIIVCIKQILDPELPPAKFSVEGRLNRVIPPEGIPPVMNPYDGLAVEAALRIKEKTGGRVSVITLGGRSSEDMVRKALAMGVDEGVMISDPVFDESDGFASALILARAIRKIGKYDLILCGRQAADWDMGMVGSVISEYLDIPVVTRAKEIQVLEEKVRVERVVMNGYETFEVPLPALVTVSSELGQARLPSGWGIIKAAKKEIPIWSKGEMDVDSAMVGKKAVRNRLLRLYVPSYERNCEFITGEDVAEITSKLTDKIRELKLV